MANGTRPCARCGALFEHAAPGRPFTVCPDCRARCSVDNCQRPHHSSGFCAVHYQQERVGRQGRCAIGGCDRLARTAGLCNAHYERQRRGLKTTGRVGSYERGDRLCKVPGCKKPRGTSGTYCPMHYERSRTSGDPGPAEPLIAPWGQATWDTPDNRRRVSRLWKFGLTPEAFNAMLAAQDGRCAICGTDDPKGNRVSTWAVDHDRSCCPAHQSCGKCVRGLLCNRCNRVLGMFGDDPVVAEAAAAYLRRYVNTKAPLSSV